MKGGTGCVGSARGGSALALLLGMGWLAAPAPGFAVPLATTQVYKLCEVQAGGYAFDQEINVAQPYEQATLCSLSVPDASAAGSAKAEFGPGIPEVGITAAGAGIGTYNGLARANFLASTAYFFEIQPIGTAPATPPASLPVLFSAHGEGYGHRVGYGVSRSVGMAHLFGDPLDYDDALFAFDVQVVDEIAYDPVDEESLGGAFDGIKFLNLFPNYTYGVVISAGCETWVGPVGQDAAASADCRARVDPFLGFDQAAFDALMGANTFRLDDYYGFVYSANLTTATPEPATCALTLVGLGLMGVAARRRHRAPGSAAR